MSLIRSSSTIVFLTTLFKILAAVGSILIIPRVNNEAFTFFTLKIQVLYNIVTYALRKAPASSLSKKSLVFHGKGHFSDNFLANLSLTHLPVITAFFLYLFVTILAISIKFFPGIYRYSPEKILAIVKPPLIISSRAGIIALIISAVAVLLELACEPYSQLASANNKVALITIPEASGSIIKAICSIIGFFFMPRLSASRQLLLLAGLLLVRPLAMIIMTLYLTFSEKEYFTFRDIYSFKMPPLAPFLASLSSAISTIIRSQSEELIVTTLASKELQNLFVSANAIASFITRYYVEPLEDICVDVFSHFKEPVQKDDSFKKLKKALHESTDFKKTQKAISKPTVIELEPSIRSKRLFVEYPALVTFILLTYLMLLISGAATYIYGQQGLFLVLASAPEFTVKLFLYLVIKTNADAYLRVLDAYASATQSETELSFSRKLFLTQFFAILQAILIYSSPNPSLVAFVLPTALHFILRFMMSIRFILRRLGAQAVVAMMADAKILRSSMIFLAVTFGVKRAVHFDCIDSSDSFVSRILSLVSFSFIFSTLIFAVSTLPLLYYCYQYVKTADRKLNS